MMQKYSHTKIYTLLLSIALLAACSSSDALTGGSTTDHPNGAIELSAGIVEGSSAAVTRTGAEDNHAKHLALTKGTELALRVSGTWTGHSPNPVVSYSTATVGDETSTGSSHNNVECSPKLYWDDFGSADPANYNASNKADGSNAAYGRGVGLTIYGVAINGKSAPTVSTTTTTDQWTDGLPWTLHSDQTTTGATPADMDLLISNNVKSSTDDGTYKFDQRESGKLLEFRHALSKITVNLRAGAGFPDDGTNSDPAVHKFEDTPEVKLTSNEGTATTNTEWPYTTGTIDVTTGGVTTQGGSSKVTMFNVATPMTDWTKTYEALVMPGSTFNGKTADTDESYPVIARIDADGNIYYVTSEMILKAIRKAENNGSEEGFSSTTSRNTEAGKNYVINVVVNKTEIEVTATVTDWVTVEAAEVAPIINITANFPNPIISRYRYDQFSFYRSLSDNGINDGYSFGDDANLIQNGFYKPESRITHTTLSLWGWDPQRYWSNHNQHYQFRLVWPRTTTDTKETDPNHPHVERKSYDDGSTYQQVIEIFNEPYEALYTESDNGTDPVTIVDDATHHPYPSNLMIARPEFMADDPSTTDVDESDPICTNNEPGHTHKHLYSEGICAREGEIVLTFRYVMSQVEVNLTTTSTESSVDLNGATVAITNVYSKGDVKLGDRGVIQTSNIGNYTLDPVAVVVDDPATEEIDENTVSKRKRHSAIVPQMLTFSTARASTNVQFKITLGNGDVYYADIQPIPVQEAGSSIPAAPVTAWESGKHYVYTLNISKTQIKATATLANWTTVEASEEVWF